MPDGANISKNFNTLQKPSICNVKGASQGRVIGPTSDL